MTTKEQATPDRRVARTRLALRQSLIALMMEKGWDSVSIQDLCEHANVGRSTFYTHFADKEELLVGGLADLKAQLQSQLEVAPGEQPLSRFARGMFEHARDHQRLFGALVGSQAGQVVLQRFRGLVVELVREELALVPGRPKVPEAVVHFIAGGFLELLAWWIEMGEPSRAAEFERQFLCLSEAALGAANLGPEVINPGKKVIKQGGLRHP